MSRLLTMPEVAARTRKPIATLRHYRWKKVGPTSFKLGRRVVYREEDVERWIEEQRGAGLVEGSA